MAGLRDAVYAEALSAQQDEDAVLGV